MPGATMIRIPAGAVLLGSNEHYSEEAPVREVDIEDFWIDRFPVTNRHFADFVAATGHRTLAEIAPDPADYPTMFPEYAQPGSAVFIPPASPTAPMDPSFWWHFIPGASWRHPHGPESSFETLLDHPVVQISYADALAYAEWAGKQLPNEAEWEYAARGGIERASYAWGDEFEPGGRQMANYWVGHFPHEKLNSEVGLRTSRVGSFPANGYGLFDMIGNVWE